METTELNNFYDHLNIHNEWLTNYRRIQPKINQFIEKKKSRKLEIVPKITIIEKTHDINCDEVVQATKTKFSDISSDFISFSSNSTPVYKPIKVRRVVGNPNRKKN